MKISKSLISIHVSSFDLIKFEKMMIKLEITLILCEFDPYSPLCLSIRDCLII